MKRMLGQLAIFVGIALSAVPILCAGETILLPEALAATAGGFWMAAREQIGH